MAPGIIASPMVSITRSISCPVVEVRVFAAMAPEMPEITRSVIMILCFVVIMSSGIVIVEIKWLGLNFCHLDSVQPRVRSSLIIKMRAEPGSDLRECDLVQLASEGVAYFGVPWW